MVDISKLQQLLTLVAAVAYAYAITRTMSVASHDIVHELREMHPGFLALIGASHATYLSYKQLTSTDNCGGMSPCPTLSPTSTF